MPETITETHFTNLLMEARRIEDAASVGGVVSQVMKFHVQLELEYES